MSDSPSKIITSFQERLELDAALRSLGDPADDSELRQRAADIAEKHGAKAIPALIGLLDTTNPQLRGGLGHLSTFLPEDKVVPALSAAARNRGLSSQARMAAVTILERFLGVEPDESMYAGMGAPEEMALQSLREVLGEAQRDRMVLVQYFSQLSLEPPDVQLTMVKAARRLEGADGVETLRLFAQDPSPAVAQEALQGLGMIAVPEAARALQTLIPTLSFEIRPLAERSLQKLRLRGVAVRQADFPLQTCRCLASPVDSQGNQVLWFVVANESGPAFDVLNVWVNPDTGLTAAAGGFEVPAENLPDRHAVGTLLNLAGQPQPLWLEAPFDYGRRRVLAGLSVNAAQNEPTPHAYRLLNPILWRWSAPSPGGGAADLPEPSSDETPALLQHPAMGSWFVQSRQVYLAAEKVLTGNDVPTPEAFAATVQELLAAELAADELKTATVVASLQAMCEWFDIAGDSEYAQLAQAAAQTIAQDPAKHPFLLQLCEIGLRLAMVYLARGMMPEFSSR